MSQVDFRLTFSGQVSSSLQGAIKSLGRSTKSLQQQFASLSKTSGQISKYRDMTRRVADLKSKMDQGGAAGARARGQWEKMSASLRDLRGELKGAGVDFNNLARSEARIARQTADVNKRLGHQARASRYRDMRRNAFTGGMMGIAAPVLALAAPIRAAVKYEEVMADVRKVTNLSSAEFRGLEKDALKMSTRIPMSAEGLGSIMAAAGQSGIAKTRPELLAFAEQAAKMGVAFDVSGAKAGDIMASWRAGMGLTQKETGELADQVNALSNKFNTSAADLAEIIQRQGAVAMTAGLSKEETAALGAAMKAGGARKEIAATGLKNFTNALSKGRMHSDVAQLAFKQMGLDVVEVAKGMQTDAQGTILNVIEAIKAKIPKHEISAVVGRIFGEESKGAIMPLVTNTKLLEEAFELVGKRANWAGSMLKEYLVRSKTTAANINFFKNRLNALAVSAGSILLPTFNQMLGSVGQVQDRILDMAEKHPEITKKLVGGTAGILGGAAGWKVLAGSTRFVAGSLGDIYHTLKSINAMRMFKGKWLGLGAVGALAYAAHELGMLEPMAKGFTAELKKGSVGILKEFKDAYAGWQKDIFGKTNIREIANWEDAGKIIGESAGKYLSESFLFWINFSKWVGSLAGSASIGDWKEVKKQTIDPLMYGAMGVWEHVREKTGLKDNKMPGGMLLWDYATKKTNTKDTKVVNFLEQPLYKVAEQTISNKALKGYWNSFDRFSHKLLGDAGSYWGNKISNTIELIKQKDAENAARERAKYGEIAQMSLSPPKEAAEKPEPPKIDLKTYDELIKKIGGLKEGVQDVFADTGKEGEKWAETLDGVFDDLLKDVRGFGKDLGFELESISIKFEHFKLEIGRIAIGIKSAFSGIGSAISGSITSELTSATSAANNLAASLEKVKAASSKASTTASRTSTTTGKPAGSASVSPGAANIYNGLSSENFWFDYYRGNFEHVINATGKASGGPIQAGRPYMVGEKGPELIFPRKPGWVANHRATQNILGSFFKGFFGGFGVLPGLLGFLNPSRMLSFGGLPGGSISGGIFEALLGRGMNRGPAPGRSGGNIGTLNFCPNINVGGAGSPAEAENRVYRAAEQGVEYFRRQVEALWSEERRLDYGS